MPATVFAGAHVLGSADVVRFGHLRMWAERGLIHIEDARDNSYKAVSVRTMLHRMRGIQDMLANSKPHLRQKHSHDQLDKAWVDDNQGMLEAMCEVVRKAQAQGMPSDPSACRDLARRRPTTILVPGYGGGL